MKTRGVIQNTEQVRGLLAGTVTELWVPMKSQPEHAWGQLAFRKRSDDGFWLYPNAKEQLLAECPLGAPGGQLWVRETFQPLLDEKLGAEPLPGEYDYKTGRGYCVSYPATDGIQEFYDMSSDGAFSSRMTPSSQMPRWASRITLKVARVSVERRDMWGWCVGVERVPA